MKVMDGLGIPILGGLIGLGAFLVCFDSPRFSRYALAALISPFAASLVFLIGLFIIADMNPALEYGAQYTPTGKEHEPTAFDNLLWLGSTAVTFLFTAIICVKIQQILDRSIKRNRSAHSLTSGTTPNPR